MKIKLNAWRLARETRLIDGSVVVNALTLRDPHGKVIRTARTPTEEEELRALWKTHDRKTRIEDLPVSKTLRKRLHSAIVRLNKRGFKYRMKFGGLRWNPPRGGREYCRWEVYKGTPWRRSEVLRMGWFFKTHSPKEPLGVYYVTVKDGHDKLLRYRLASRRK